MAREFRGIPTLAEQIAAAAAPSETERHRFNPHPPGVIRHGGVSEAVLMILRAHSGFFTCGQLVYATKRNERTVAWALVYLQRIGQVLAVSDSRNPRYKRYTFAGNRS